MTNDKFRRQIAFEAARMMYERQESEYFRAKLRAAKKICRGWVKPRDLPSNREIRDQIQHFARLHEGDGRTDKLREMRVEALRMMRLPARLSGFAEMHDFLERGFSAFEGLGNADEFLATVESRESSLLEKIFSGDRRPFPEPPLG